ncbi:MAG: EamA family transporter [Actinobacteria bacterium]|nr:EamA family transporter [Actinomycetota bacterium]
MSSLVKSILLIILSILIAIGGQVLLKIGMNQISSAEILSLNGARDFFLAILRSPLVMTGLFLYGLSAIVWLIILSRVDLSFAYPMIGISYIFMIFISRFLLKEHVSPLRWIGAVVISIGVVIITRS